MKIVAVIPARAGSKGIPNKNIRVINGKPLIWYAIHNALSSKYINKIIITTDSDEIISIAQQMGVNVHRRDASLCGDSITLDSVIYDALKDTDFDYAITMQPTSPTLTAETLDKAISLALDGGWDTVISAHNAPHLAWIEKEEKVTPAYTERLNRQYLPPYYIETGAFVISNQISVSPTSRIGQKVTIFDIPEEEALDIDSFTDLLAAENFLNKKNVGFYVNGNNQRGLGHIYRVLELADAFYIKPDIYFNKQETDIRLFGETTHTLIGLEKEEDIFEAIKNKKYRFFINDILNTSSEFIERLREVSGAKIINFEDDGDGSYHADLVFNALYQEENSPHIKAGEKYYVANRLFSFYNPITIKPNVEHIFISFGGADPQNYTDRLLNIVSKDKYKNYKFTIVIGRAKENVPDLMANNGKYPNITVLYDVKNMPVLMSGCDIAFTSRGRTGYELAILGVPTIVMAQNKREEKHGFVSHENGFNYLGLNPSDFIIESNLDLYINLDKEERQKIQNHLLSHDLRNGRNRVINLIENL